MSNIFGNTGVVLFTGENTCKVFNIGDKVQHKHVKAIGTVTSHLAWSPGTVQVQIGKGPEGATNYKAEELEHVDGTGTYTLCPDTHIPVSKEAARELREYLDGVRKRTIKGGVMAAEYLLAKLPDTEVG